MRKLYRSKKQKNNKKETKQKQAVHFGQLVDQLKSEKYKGIA